MRNKLICLLAIALTSAGCATVQTDAVNDPFERANRAVFRFNMAADRRVLRPVANTYHEVTPDRVERSIGKFFDNLASPVVIVNDLLQGKFKQAGADTGRFLLNSTVGVLGFLDVARRVGLEAHQEDLGQTLARWGVRDGPYLMVPFLGPMTVRDGLGRLLDIPLHPLRYHDDKAARNSLVLLNGVDIRAGLLEADDALDDAFDGYLFVKDAYLQRRQYLIYDGDPPAVEDEFADEYVEDEFSDSP